jgi:LEA14-like dessication related protein
MGERALRVGLLLLSLALYVGPILAAFASEGWDLRSTLIGDMGPFEDLTSEGKEPTVEAGEPTFQGKVTLENDLPPLVVSVTLTNSYSFRLGMKEVSLEVFCSDDGFRVGEGMLEEDVAVEPESRENFRIVLRFTHEGSRHLLEQHVEGSYLHARLRMEGSFTLDIYGIEIRVPVEEEQELYQEVEG